MFLHKTCNWLINVELYSLQQPDKFLGTSLIPFVLVGVQCQGLSGTFSFLKFTFTDSL